MRKTIKLTESDLTRIVKRVIKEDIQNNDLYLNITNTLRNTNSSKEEKIQVLEYILREMKGEGFVTKEKVNPDLSGLEKLVHRVMRKGIDEQDFNIDGVEDFDFPEDPNLFNKWHIEELLKVYDVDEANEILNSHYPEYSLEIKMETPDGKSIGFMSPEGEEISGKYIVGCCGGRGSSENMNRFKRSDDAFYDPRKRY
jgi:hypothetical protein